MTDADLRELALKYRTGAWGSSAEWQKATQPTPILALLDRVAAAEQTERALIDALRAAEQVRDEAYAKSAALAETSFARIHTYTSENSDRYIAMRDAGNEIAKRIRALQAKE